VKKGQNGRKSLRRLKSPQWVVTPIKEEEVCHDYFNMNLPHLRSNQYGGPA